MDIYTRPETTPEVVLATLVVRASGICPPARERIQHAHLAPVLGKTQLQTSEVNLVPLPFVVDNQSNATEQPDTRALSIRSGYGQLTRVPRQDVQDCLDLEKDDMHTISRYTQKP